jgi:lysophospholipase L1-like esterase
VRRVVVLGDSFTFGAMVEVEQRFTDLLALGDAHPEVINLGTSAYGTDQELRLLEVEGLHYAPDVVLAEVFLGNDLDDIRYERHFAWPKPHYELEPRGLRFVAAQASWDVWFRESSYLGELAFDLVDGRLVERNHVAAAWETADTLPLLCALMTAMDQRARQAEARLLAVLVYPCESMRGPPNTRETRVRAALDQTGLALLDTHAEFAARTQAGAMLYSQPDGHWNVAGHALAAELIQGELRRRKWLEERR